MPSTFTPISYANLITTTASVTFSSIPQTYTDLVCIVSSHTANGGDFSNIQTLFNGDNNNANYAYNLIYNQGASTPSVGAGNAGWWGYISGNIGAYGVLVSQIQSYSTTNRFKTLVNYQSNGVVNNPLFSFEISATTWKSTSAITSMVVNGSNGGFAAGSRIELFGIKAA